MRWEYLLVRWTVTREGLPAVFEVDGAAVGPAPLVDKLRDLGAHGAPNFHPTLYVAWSFVNACPSRDAACIKSLALFCSA